MLTTIILALAAPAGNPANNASPSISEDRVICQRETPTGSLITSRRLCLTKAEWNALELDYKFGDRRAVEDIESRSPGA